MGLHHPSDNTLANFALWYAKRIEPKAQVESETVAEDKTDVPSGVEINPDLPDTTTAWGTTGTDTNTAQPLEDVYDYEGDNKTPSKVKYRIWATNKNKKTPNESDKEIANLDTGGVYYRELNYQDVMPEGLRTQKLWIPVQFISKTVQDSQPDRDSDSLRILGENKFTVSEFKLYLLTFN